MALAAGFAVAAALSESSALAGQSVNRKLNPGDIIYADSGDAVHGGFIIKIDASSGQQTVLSSGGYLQLPFDPVVDATGEITVSDSGRLIGINPETGTQSIIADKTRGALGLPYGIAFNESGEILAANLEAIVLVPAGSGQIQVLAQGGSLGSPLGVVEGSSGELYVLSVGMKKQIIRINRQTGLQQVVSEGGYFKNPQALANHEEAIYITDVATPDGNFGVGRVIRVDARNGAQTIVSEGGYLVGPVGISIDGAGQLIVGDPYTVKRKSADLYDGGIIRINPVTGHQTLIARGHSDFVNPRGVGIVPIRATTHKQASSQPVSLDAGH